MLMGSKQTHNGVGSIAVRFRTEHFQVRVVVPETEDKGILGIDFLSQVDSHIFKHCQKSCFNLWRIQPLSFRSRVRRHGQRLLNPTRS